MYKISWMILSGVLLMLLAACGGVDDITPLPVEPNGDRQGYLRSAVYINEASLVIMESYPIQVMLTIKGELPTPCHTFQTEISMLDDTTEIHVNAYSEVKADENCIQVLAPFEENVPLPLGGLADGTYSVWLNGEKVGEFNYPGG